MRTQSVHSGGVQSNIGADQHRGDVVRGRMALVEQLNGRIAKDRGRTLVRANLVVSVPGSNCVRPRFEIEFRNRAASPRSSRFHLRKCGSNSLAFDRVELVASPERKQSAVTLVQLQPAQGNLQEHFAIVDISFRATCRPLLVRTIGMRFVSNSMFRVPRVAQKNGHIVQYSVRHGD